MFLQFNDLLHRKTVDTESILLLSNNQKKWLQIQLDNQNLHSQIADISEDLSEMRSKNDHLTEMIEKEQANSHKSNAIITILSEFLSQELKDEFSGRLEFDFESFTHRIKQERLFHSVMIKHLQDDKTVLKSQIHRLNDSNHKSTQHFNNIIHNLQYEKDELQQTIRDREFYLEELSQLHDEIAIQNELLEQKLSEYEQDINESRADFGRVKTAYDEIIAKMDKTKIAKATVRDISHVVLTQETLPMQSIVNDENINSQNYSVKCKHMSTQMSPVFLSISKEKNKENVSFFDKSPIKNNNPKFRPLFQRIQERKSKGKKFGNDNKTFTEFKMNILNRSMKKQTWK